MNSKIKHPSLHHLLSGSGFLATMSETDVQRTEDKVRSISRGGRRLQSDNTQPSLLLSKQETPQAASSRSIAETLQQTGTLIHTYFYI